MVKSTSTMTADMIITAYIKTTHVEGAIPSLLALPSGLRPRYYSSEEESGKSKGSLDHAKDFQQFMTKNKFGFFLFSERAKYNIVVRPNQDFFTLSVHPISLGLTELDAVMVFEALAGRGLAFGFAAHVDEYHHRNRYLRKIGINRFEGWVGRDLGKHIPGIYWLTVLSEKYCHIIPQSPTAITDCARIERLGTRHWVIKAFEDMNDWAQYAPYLDGWCAEHPDVFSMKRIQSQLDSAENIADLMKLVAQWH